MIYTFLSILSLMRDDWIRLGFAFPFNHNIYEVISSNQVDTQTGIIFWNIKKYQDYHNWIIMFVIEDKDKLEQFRSRIKNS